MGGPCFLAVEGKTKKTHAPPCTDNFQIRPFEYEGKSYWSCEQALACGYLCLIQRVCTQAYQALKFPPGRHHDMVVAVSPFAGESDSNHGMRAWQKGQSGRCRGDWDSVKLSCMLEVNRAKYGERAD